MPLKKLEGSDADGEDTHIGTDVDNPSFISCSATNSVSKLSTTLKNESDDVSTFYC